MTQPLPNRLQHRIAGAIIVQILWFLDKVAEAPSSQSVVLYESLTNIMLTLYSARIHHIETSHTQIHTLQRCIIYDSTSAPLSHPQSAKPDIYQTPLVRT